MNLESIFVIEHNGLYIINYDKLRKHPKCLEVINLLIGNPFHKHEDFNIILTDSIKNNKGAILYLLDFILNNNEYEFWVENRVHQKFIVRTGKRIVLGEERFGFVNSKFIWDYNGKGLFNEVDVNFLRLIKNEKLLNGENSGR